MDQGHDHIENVRKIGYILFYRITAVRFSHAEIKDVVTSQKKVSIDIVSPQRTKENVILVILA